MAEAAVTQIGESRGCAVYIVADNVQGEHVVAGLAERTAAKSVSTSRARRSLREPRNRALAAGT